MSKKKSASKCRYKVVKRKEKHSQYLVFRCKRKHRHKKIDKDWLHSHRWAHVDRAEGVVWILSNNYHPGRDSGKARSA